MSSFSKRKTAQAEVTETPIGPAAKAGDEELMGGGPGAMTQLEKVVAEAVAKAMEAASAATSAGAAEPSKPAAVPPPAVTADPTQRSLFGEGALGHPPDRAEDSSSSESEEGEGALTRSVLTGPMVLDPSTWIDLEDAERSTTALAISRQMASLQTDRHTRKEAESSLRVLDLLLRAAGRVSTPLEADELVIQCAQLVIGRLWVMKKGGDDGQKAGEAAERALFLETEVPAFLRPAARAAATETGRPPRSAPRGPAPRTASASARRRSGATGRTQRR